MVGPDDRILVVRCASEGCWELPGGRLDEDERPRDGLRREIREETGIDPMIDEPVSTHAWRNDRDEGRFAVYYHCECSTRTVSLSHEHDNFRWCDPHRARALLSDPQGRAVDRAVPNVPFARNP